MDASQTPQTPQDPQASHPQAIPPQPPTPKPHVNPPQDSTPPATGTWLKLDARDPEAEAAEAAYRKESSRLRRGVWIGNCVALLLLGGVVAALGYVIIPRLGRPS